MSKSLLLHEQFEDGTINYLSLPAISAGLRILDSYMPFLPLRLSILLHSLARSLADLRHTKSNTPVVQLLSHMPEDRLYNPNQNSSAGFVLSFLFLDVSFCGTIDPSPPLTRSAV
jgi:molybdenum cofactor sulfurtransferase